VYLLCIALMVLRTETNFSFMKNENMICCSSARLTPTPNVNFMCTLGSEYIPTRQRPLTFTSRQPATIGSPRQLPRGRSPYRQSAQNLNMVYIFCLKLLKVYLYFSYLTFISNRLRSFLWMIDFNLKFQVGRAPLFGRQRSRSRSRSRSRTYNTTTSDSSGDIDDRSFSEVMYSLSGNLGVTGRTLNDRFRP